MSFHAGTEILESPFKYITGKLFHESRYMNHDAGDLDWFGLDTRASVGFWYTPPLPGPRQVWVKILVGTSRADVWLDNEYGFSFTDLCINNAILTSKKREARSGECRRVAPAG